MINGVKSYGANIYTTNQNSIKPTAQDTISSAQTDDSANPAVKNDISDEARKISFELKEYGADSFLKLDESFFSQEAREQRKADFAKSLSEHADIDPFDNEFQILGVTAIFNEGTLEKHIADNLDGKAKNASLVASELGQMIRGAAYNSAGTVEERAVNRETALKHAEYIAQNYFENPDEAKSFLDGIKKFAENDILREKGYVVIDNSGMAPFKAYQSSLKGNSEISWDAYAKQAGYSSAREIFENKETLNSFYNSLSNNSKTWEAQIIKSFAENEKNVADIINRVKNTLNENDVANSLQRIMKAL